MDFNKLWNQAVKENRTDLIKSKIDEYSSSFNDLVNAYNSTIASDDMKSYKPSRSDDNNLYGKIQENKQKASELMDIIKANKEALGTEYDSIYKSVSDSYTSLSDMRSNTANYYSFWNQFDNEDQFNNYKYTEKYSGSSLADIDSAISGFDSKYGLINNDQQVEYDWLNKNRARFMTDDELKTEVEKSRQKTQDATKNSFMSTLGLIGDALSAGMQSMSGMGGTSEDINRNRSDIKKFFSDNDAESEAQNKQVLYENELYRRYAELIKSNKELETDLGNYQFYINMRNSQSTTPDAISASGNAKEIREKWINSGVDFDEIYKAYSSGKTQEILEDLSEFSAEHPIIGTVGSLTMTPIAGIGAVDSVVSVLSGNDIDINSPAYYPSLIKSTMRNAIEDKYADNPFFSGVSLGKDSFSVDIKPYEILTSALDSALNLAIGSALGNAGASVTAGSVEKWVSGMTSLVMGSGVATEAIITGKEKGYTDIKAVSLGVIQGLIEGVTEKYSIETILSNPTSILGTAAKSFLAEGSEETASNMLNRLVDIVANGNQSDILSAYYGYIEQGKSKSEAAALAFVDAAGEDLSAFIAGGISGVGMGAVGNAETFSNTYKTGHAVNQNQNTQNLIDDAAVLSSDIKTNKAQKLYDKSSYSNAESANKNKVTIGQRFNDVRSNYATGRLYNAVQNELRGQASGSVKSAVNERLISEGITPADATEMSDIITRITSNEDVSRSERKSIQNNRIASQVLNELDEAYAQLYFEKFGLDLEIGENSEWAKGAISDFMDQSAQLNEYAANEQKNQDIIKAEEPQTKKSDSEIIVDTETESKRIYGETGTKTLEFFLKSSDETTENTVRELFDEYYNAGALGTMSVEAVHQTVNDSVLTREYSKNIKSDALAAGIVDYESNKPSSRSSVKKGGVVNRERAVNELNMNSAAVDLMDSVSKKLGVNIQINPTLEVSGGNPRGVYDNGTIYISAEATKNDTELFAVFSHELCHYLQEIAPEQYRDFKRFVIENIKKHPGKYSEILGRMKLTYRQVQKNMLDMAIMDEITADSMELFLSDTQFIEEAINHDHSFVEKVLDKIKEFLKDIKESIKSFGTNTSSRTLNYIIRQQDKFQQGVDLVESMLNKGANVVEHVNQKSDSKNTAREDGGVTASTKFSFAGEKAKTTNYKRLDDAIRLEDVGKATAEEIRQQTGWFRGYDGKWRFEIDDSKMEFSRKGFFTNPDVLRYQELADKFLYGEITAEENRELQALKKSLEGVKLRPKTLGDYVRHEELFKAYPELKNLKVTLRADMPTEDHGSYNYKKKEIVLNSFWAKFEDAFTYTLIHEIQHAIQDIEGFSGGSSPDYWARVPEDMKPGTYEYMIRKRDEIGDKILASGSPEFIQAFREYNRGDIEYSDVERVATEEESELLWDHEEAYRDAQYFKEHPRTNYNLYNSTAGEVEARDVSKRIGYDTEKRKNTRPDIDRTDVVFADGSGESYSQEYLTATVNQDVINLIQKVKSKQYKDNDTAEFGIVDESTAQEIKNITGIDVTGYKMVIEARQVYHILKDHGIEGKTDHSMANDSDIARIGYVLTTYNNIIAAGKTEAYKNMINGYNKSAKTILYEKEIGENLFYVVQAIPETKSKKLYVVTAFIGEKGYKKEASQFINAKSPDATSESETVKTSNNSISISDKNVNIKYLLDSESEGNIEYIGQIDTGMNSSGMKISELTELMTSNLHEIINGNMPTNTEISKIASSFISRYGSNMSRKELTEKITTLLEYIRNDNPNSKSIAEACFGLAKQVIEKANSKDSELNEQYKDLRKDILRRTIFINRLDLSDEDIKQIASLTNRRFYITTDPNKRSAKVRDIDEYYDELHNDAPDFFPETNSPMEQLTNIVAFLDATSIRIRNIYDSGEMGMSSDEAARILGSELYYTIAKAVNEHYGTKESKRVAELYYDAIDAFKKQRIDSNKSFVEYAKQKDTQTAMYRELAYRKIEEKKAELKAGIERRQVINQLKKLYSSSMKLLNGSRADKMGVPAEHKKVFLDVLELINFVDDRFEDSKLNYKYQDMRSRLIAMRTRLEDISKNAESNGNDVVSEEVIEYIKSLEYVTENGEKSITQLKTDELKLLKSAIEHFKGIITNANKMFTDELNRTRDEYGQAIISELINTADQKSITHGTKLQMVHSALNVNQMMPIYFFENIGGTMNRLWVNLMNTEGKQSDILEDAVKSANGIMKKYNFNKWAFDTPAMEITIDGKKVQIELMEAMSLYAIAKREKGNIGGLSETSHLLNGGITIKKSEESFFKKMKEAIKKRKDPISSDSVQNIAGKVSEHEINKISDILTDEQKKFVDAMVGYLSNDLAAVGNEASRKMYNYDIFTEDYYFPMSVDDNYLASSPDKGQPKQAKNSSFTKHITLGSNAPVVISNFMDVWMNHVSQMSVYAATAPALNDFMRVYNYKDGANTVKGLLKDRYGDDYDEYIMKLIEDLNGGYRTDSTGQLSDALIRNMKTAAVSLSLSCAIQQPSAIGRAYAYLGVSKTRSPSKKGYDEMMKYSALARIKNSAGYDTMSGHSLMYEMMYGEENIREKTKLFFENLQHKETRSLSREQLEQLGFLLPGFMDSVTWSAIWNSCKAQVRSQNKYKYESEEYFNAVTELFDDVVRHTQVYDTTFQRSGNLRSTNALVKTEMAFMSEPTVTMNMLMSTKNDIKNGNKNIAARKIGGVIISMLLNTLLKSIMTAFYKWDDDKEWWKDYLADIPNNLISDAGSMIPYVKDIVSMFEGYDVERMDLTSISRLINAWNQLTSDDKSPVEKISNVAGYVADIFGLPGTTIKKNCYAFYNNFIAGGADAGIPYLEMIETVKNGNSEKLGQMYDDLIAAGYKKTTITDGYRNTMAEYIPEVQEAAEYLMNNDESNYYSVCRELMDMGFDHSDIKAAVKIAMENMQNRKVNPLIDFVNAVFNKNTNEKIEIPDYENPVFVDMVDAVLDGDQSSFTDIYNQLYADGYTESKIQSGYREVMADVIPEVKEAAEHYINGEMGSYSVKIGEIAKMGFTLADAKAAVNVIINDSEQGLTDSEKFVDSRFSDIGADKVSAPTKTTEEELFDGAIYDYNMLYDVLLEQGSNGKDYKEMYNYFIDNGKSPKKIQSAMDSRAEKTVKACINAANVDDFSLYDKYRQELAVYYGNQSKATSVINEHRKEQENLIKKYLNSSGTAKSEYIEALIEEYSNWDTALKGIEYYKKSH